MIYVVRHGQTEMNQANVLQGRSDVPLNAKGIAQARSVGAWFATQGITFDAVYSSPLVRAVQTAQLIAGASVPVITDDRLLEMDYGPYEGMSLANPAPEIITFFSDFVHNPAPEGMESLSSVVSRSGSLLEEIKAAGVRGNVLLSAHAISMKGVLEYLTPESGGSYWSKYIANCGVYAFDQRDNAYTVPAEVPVTPIPDVKLAFFDMDGTLCAPRYRDTDGSMVIGFTDAGWRAFCDATDGRGYEDCKPLPCVQTFAKALKIMGCRLFVLTACGSASEKNSKEAYIRETFPELFESVIFVDSDDEKIGVVCGKAQEEGFALSACLLVEDTLKTLLAAHAQGIVAVHVSNIVTGTISK